MQPEYVLQNYDHVLITSSWGMPSGYRESYYVMELVTIDGKRRIMPSREDPQYSYHSSTSAIKRILERIGIKNIELLIFSQDTILLNRVIKNWNRYSQRKMTKKDMEEELLRELYELKREVAYELGVEDPKGYRALVRFVPGVISSARGVELYTWRGKRVYDVMLGSIALYTYKKLKEFGDTRRIVIVLDMTHGMNYFVTALKEGVSIGASLYAFSRATDSQYSGLDELIIYHYNSDPVMKAEEHSISSLKLHLLDEVPIVRNGSFNPNTICSHLETQVLIKGISGLDDQLSKLWRVVKWRRVIDTLLLFLRGSLSWALRNALEDIGSIPRESDLVSAIEQIELRFEEKREGGRLKRNITYELGKNIPSIHIVVLALLFNTLRDLAERTMIRGNKDIKSYIKNLMKELEAEASTKEASEFLEGFVKGNFICLDLEGLINIANRLYLPPHREINEHEFKNLKEYLLGKEPHWRRSVDRHNLKVYEEYSRSAYFIVHDNIRFIVSREKQVERRDFLAHAGLAYGLQWLGLGMHGRVILCLGDPSKPAELIQ